jgi:hypothetical protein
MRHAHPTRAVRPGDGERAPVKVIDMSNADQTLKEVYIFATPEPLPQRVARSGIRMEGRSESQASCTI